MFFVLFFDRMVQKRQKAAGNRISIWDFKSVRLIHHYPYCSGFLYFIYICLIFYEYNLSCVPELNHTDVGHLAKGELAPEHENCVINCSPSCCSKLVRPSFIFRTQIKIFLMQSESSLTLPSTARILTRSRLRNVARRSLK